MKNQFLSAIGMTAMIAASFALSPAAGAQAPDTAGAATTPPHVEITVNYVTTSLTDFVKKSYQIAPGKEHDALLLAALVKDGAQDTLAPQVTTTAGVQADLSVSTQIGPSQVAAPALTSSIQAKPKFNKDGSITVTIMSRKDTPLPSAVPSTLYPSVTSSSFTTTGTFIDGQTLLIEYGSGYSDPSDPDHEANTSSMSLVFATVKTVKSDAMSPAAAQSFNHL